MRLSFVGSIPYYSMVFRNTTSFICDPEPQSVLSTICETDERNNKCNETLSTFLDIVKV